MGILLGQLEYWTCWGLSTLLDQLRTSWGPYWTSCFTLFQITIEWSLWLQNLRTWYFHLSVHSKLHRPLKKFCPSDPFAQTPAPLCLIFKAGHILMGGGDLTLCCFQKMHQSPNLWSLRKLSSIKTNIFHILWRGGFGWSVGWGEGTPNRPKDTPHWGVSFAALHFIQCLCVGPFVSGQCSKVSFAVLPSMLDHLGLWTVLLATMDIICWVSPLPPIHCQPWSLDSVPGCPWVCLPAAPQSYWINVITPIHQLPAHWHCAAP